MIQLLHPLMLAGLVGLLVPVLIHLWARRERPPVLYGSIRYFHPAEVLQPYRFRFSQWWLLIARMVLLSILVLLLTDLVWIGKEDQAAGQAGKWLLIEPQLAGKEDVIGQIKSLAQKDYELRYLTSGFPKVQDDPAVVPDGSLNYWSLLESINYHADMPDSVIVLATPYYWSFQGPVPKLHYALDWRFLPVDQPEPVLLEAWTAGPDTPYVRVGFSSEIRSWYRDYPLLSRTGSRFSIEDLDQLQIEGKEIFFTKQPGRRVPVADFRPLSVGIAYEELLRADARYLHAAMRALAGVSRRKISIEAFQAEQLSRDTFDWLFWLSEQPWPATESINIVHYQPRAASGPLIDSIWVADRWVYRLNKYLYPVKASAMVDLSLPHELLRLFYGEDAEGPAFWDKRQLAAGQFVPAVADREKRQWPLRAAIPQSMHFYLYLLALLTLIIERILANIRNGESE